MSHHLGFEKGDPAGWGSSKNRNGSYDKNMLTDAGSIPVQMSRDQEESSEPDLILEHQRRLSGFNDLVMGLVARGMTTRDVRDHVTDR